MCEYVSNKVHSTLSVKEIIKKYLLNVLEVNIIFPYQVSPLNGVDSPPIRAVNILTQNSDPPQKSENPVVLM